MNGHPTRPDGDDQSAEYQRQFAVAADALVAAIRTGVTDGGETISRLLATVAANLGGAHKVTEGRPGSWEASHVEQLLASTVGSSGEYLLQYRTAPIEIVECVELAMVDLDIDYLYDESLTLIDAIETEAATSDGDAAYDRLDRAVELLDCLRDRDDAAYREAFEQSVAEAVRELVGSRSLPVDVPVSVRWVDWADRSCTTGSQGEWGTVEHGLWESARGRTPPPGFSEPLDAITGVPGDVLLATGRMPHHRVPELVGYVRTATAAEAV